MLFAELCKKDFPEPSAADPTPFSNALTVWLTTTLGGVSHKLSECFSEGTNLVPHITQNFAQGIMSAVGMERELGGFIPIVSAALSRFVVNAQTSYRQSLTAVSTASAPLFIGKDIS